MNFVEPFKKKGRSFVVIDFLFLFCITLEYNTDNWFFSRRDIAVQLLLNDYVKLERWIPIEK